MGDLINWFQESSRSKRITIMLIMLLFFIFRHFIEEEHERQPKGMQ